MSRNLLTPAALLLTVAIAAALCSRPAAAAGTTLAFSPAAQTVSSGAHGNVDVTVANVTNLGGYDIQVTFNASIVHVTGMTDTGFLATPQNVPVCNPATIDNTAGTASLVCSVVNPFGAPGPGVSTTAAAALLHVAFTAVGTGTSALSLTGSTLSDPAGAPITATLSSGSVTVGAAASVGGVAEMPDVAALPAGGGGNGRLPIAIALTIAGALLAAGALSLRLVGRR